MKVLLAPTGTLLIRLGHQLNLPFEAPIVK